MKRIICTTGLTFCLGMIATLIFAQTNRGVGVRVKDASGQTREINLYSGSYALVIGESDYTDGWESLSGVPGDVTAVRRILERHGFKVEISENLTSRDFDSRIKQFIDDYGFEPNNRLLIYFAGHGHTLKSAGDGRQLGYIVPVDAPLAAKDETGFRRKAVSMDAIQTYAKEIQAKHALFIFDSCFSGKLVTRGEIAVPPFIQENVAFAVRQFITAGAANQPVPDDSIFRRSFVRGLEGEADRNKDGYVTGTELADYLKEKVTNYSERRQTPQYGKINDVDLDRGDFVFLMSQFTASSNAPTPPDKCGGETTKLKIISRPAPSYTDKARQNNVIGNTSLKVQFLASGEIGEITVLHGLPDGLTEQSVAAARRIKFIPAKECGVPQTRFAVIEHSFTIY